VTEWEDLLARTGILGDSISEILDKEGLDRVKSYAIQQGVEDTPCLACGGPVRQAPEETKYPDEEWWRYLDLSMGKVMQCIGCKKLYPGGKAYLYPLPK